MWGCGPKSCSEQLSPLNGRVLLKPDGTRWRTGGEVKGKLANGVGSQYSHTTSERGVSSATNADAHTSAASSRLNWRPRPFKWTRPFRRKTKSGFCACAFTFQTPSNYILLPSDHVVSTDHMLRNAALPQTLGHGRPTCLWQKATPDFMGRYAGRTLHSNISAVPNRFNYSVIFIVCT